MAESLITLGPAGKRLLEKRREHDINLQRRPPRQLEHWLGVNDVRIAAELTPGLKYFFAFWELPGVQWAHRLVPDAIFALSNGTFAVELDRGQESLRFFVKTKIEVYRRGFSDVSLHAVLVVVDSETRMRSLMASVRPSSSPLKFLFSTVDRIQKGGFQNPIFHECFGERICITKPVVSKCSVDRTVSNE